MNHPDANNTSPSAGTNNLQTGQIEIKASPDNKGRISFYISARKITIDWGDGQVDALPPDCFRKEFTHKYFNQSLQTIKVNTEGMTLFNCSKTEERYCSDGIFHELRFGNCPELIRVSCSVLCDYDSTCLTLLDVSKCAVLTHLDCSFNQLTSLDVSNNTLLTELQCCENQLTSLDVSKNVKLMSLNCHHNQLTRLEVDKCLALRNLDCSYNDLSFLDVNENTELTALHCDYNKLSWLDLRTNKLTRLSCSNNKITSLIVNIDTLTHLYCDNNWLMSLNVSGCATLTVLDCSNNQLSEGTLNSLLYSLPTRKIYCGSNPGYDTCEQNKIIAERKGWKVFADCNSEYEMESSFFRVSEEGYSNECPY